MQKYTPLKEGVNEPLTSLEPPQPTPVTAPTTLALANGYAIEPNSNSPLMDTTDNVSALAAASKHYTNKTNMAKLQWWNAPTTPITFDPPPLTSSSSFPHTNGDEHLKTTTQEGREHINDNEFSTQYIQPNETPKIQQTHDHQEHSDHHHQHHHHHHHSHHGTGDAGVNTPLSKSASSSRHKLHHMSSTSNERLSQKIPMTNQFSIEEDPDQARQDSQLLLNGKLEFKYNCLLFILYYKNLIFVCLDICFRVK